MCFHVFRLVDETLRISLKTVHFVICMYVCMYCASLWLPNQTFGSYRHSVKTETSRKMRNGIVQSKNNHKSDGFDTKCVNIKWHTLKYAQAEYQPIANTGFRNYVEEVSTVRTPLLNPFLPTTCLSSAGRLFQAWIGRSGTDRRVDSSLHRRV